MSDHEHDEVDGEMYGDDHFSVGDEILLETMDGVVAGVFMGFSEFGIVYNATHRTKTLMAFVTAETRESIRKEFEKQTVAELKEMMVEIGVKPFGKKADMVVYLTNYSCSSLEGESGVQSSTIALKRPVLSMVMWPQIISMSAFDDISEEAMLAEFAESLERGLAIGDDDSLIGPDASDS